LWQPVHLSRLGVRSIRHGSFVDAGKFAFVYTAENGALGREIRDRMTVKIPFIPFLQASTWNLQLSTHATPVVGNF
jgi:hypothetical protein